MSHALERTNPKGVPFIGRCMSCGKENIPLEKMWEYCPGNLTEEEALLIAVNPEFKDG